MTSAEALNAIRVDLALKDARIVELQRDVAALIQIADNLAAIADHGECYSCRTGGPCWYPLAMEKLADIKERRAGR